MALNKNALLRYKTIDKCLQNKNRRWTLQNLIEACSDALYEFEGRQVDVSTRTVQLDIQMMRSNKLGYNAPIVVYEKKFYKYENDDYTITDIPLNESDMNVLSETVEMLKQFKDFSLFSELGGIIQKLEDRIYTEKSNKPSIIHFDKNENLKGLEYLDTLYQAILKKIVLNITYQAFTARNANTFTFHPFILKEFNNRWFLIGRKYSNQPILNLALDRIVKVDLNLNETYLDENFDGDIYYKNTYGVSVLRPEDVKIVILKIEKDNTPYVITKPLHKTQKIVEGDMRSDFIIVHLEVHINYELERLILGFGNSIEVLAPKQLRHSVAKKIKLLHEKYLKNC